MHPECRHEVVELADHVGSTERILEWVTAAPAGSVLAVGTEIHMVQRLAAENPDKTVLSLDPLICPCSTMFRIDEPHLAWCLEALVGGEVVNQIVVDDETARARAWRCSGCSTSPARPAAGEGRLIRDSDHQRGTQRDLASEGRHGGTHRSVSGDQHEVECGVRDQYDGGDQHRSSRGAQRRQWQHDRDHRTRYRRRCEHCEGVGRSSYR